MVSGTMSQASATPVLTTARLRLWMADREDAAEMLRFQEDNRDHFAPWSPPAPQGFLSLAYWRERLPRQQREHRDGRSACFVISWRDRDPGRIIGTANFTEIVRGPLQKCLLGYGLDRHEQGKGVMTEALRAAVEYAFETLKLHRICASYNPLNGRSGAVLKRLGFAVEGYARDYLFSNGAWEDHVLTALVHPRPGPPRL